MKFKTLLVLLMMLFVAESSYSQTFASKVSQFSRSKPVTIYFVDGDSISGTIRNVFRRKGVINQIELKVDGVKTKIDMSKVAYVYLPENIFNKMNNVASGAFRLDDEDAKFSKRQDLLVDGYALFESVKATIKKNNTNYLLQLLNPHFDKRIKVYADPYASETMSVGYAGMAMVGGEDKSYYLKYTDSDEPAFYVSKKDFKNNFKEILKDCPELTEELEKYLSWADFEQYIYKYNNCK